MKIIHARGASGHAWAGLLAILPLLVLSSGAAAQGRPGALPAVAHQRPSLAPGDRVRMTLPCDPPGTAVPPHAPPCTREGTVTHVTAETLEVTVGPTRERHTVSSLTGLEVKRVTGPGWAIPVAVGAVTAGGGTYAWLHSGGSTSRCDRSRNQDAMSGGECAALVVLGSAVGGGLGFLASRLLRTERWLPVPLGRVDLTLGRF